MIAFSTMTLLLAGVVLAVLVAVATGAIVVGLRMRQRAVDTIEHLSRSDRLLRASPALALLIRSDGRLEMPNRLAERLGYGEPPATLAELQDGEDGIDEASLPLLLREVAGAQRAAKPFRVPVRAKGSMRISLAVGERAPSAIGAPGSVLVWFFDATEFEAEIAQLTSETAELGAAFEALSGIIEAAPMPMWYRDGDLRLAMVNTAYVRAVDARDAREVIERQVELVDGEGIGGPLAGAAIARDTGEPQAGAMPATIGGARRMLRVHDVPLPDGGTAGFAIDTHELEETRGGFRRFREAQRAMLDRLSAGVAQFGPDRHLLFCNQPFRRTFGMRNEWLADRPEFDRVLERMREANRLPEVRDFPGWKNERRGWFSAAEGAIEEQWHLPGGTHLRVVAQPLPDGGLLLVFEDRTEQVQLASARDTLLRVRTATFDNLFEALGVFSADGRLQLWNSKFRQVWGLDESFLTGHPRVDSIAQAVAPRLKTPSRAGLIPELVRFATADRVQRGGRVTMADGRHFEFGAVPLPDGNALLTMIDISDSRRIEQALRDRNEALEAGDRVKTAFLATMSYELRTPLTSIKGFAEMLEAGFAGTLTEDGNRYAKAILESVDRLGTLIDDVLDLTATEGTPFARKPVDLAAVAAEAANASRPGANAKRIELATEIDPAAGTIVGDQRRLRQAIEHLLDHAIAATREKGRVLLHVDGDGDGARIVVSDDGPGMDPDAAAHAFDRFGTNVPRTGKRALGFGLPLAKQFVEAHGGTIGLVSEKGQGTLVTITLPRG